MLKIENLPEKWKVKRLTDICDVRDGTHDSPKYVNEGYPLITSKNLTKGFIDFSQVNLISKDDYDKVNKRSFVDDKDILMPMIGTIGNPIIVKKEREFAIKNVALIKFTKTDVSNKFIKLFLESIHFKRYIKRINRGGTQKFISLKDIRNIPIILPPLKIQQKIVEILTKVEKILEWRAKSDRLANVYLKSIFLELFGDHRKNDRNFDIKSFMDIFNLTTGKLNSNASVKQGKYPFFTCSKETFKIDNYSFDCEALLLSGNNAAGEYSIKYYNGKFDAYQRTYVLSLKDKNNSYEFYRMLLEEKLKELKDKSIGTNTKYLTLNILKGINLIEPNYELQNKFEKIIKHVEILKTHQLQSKQEIDNLYNTLMQKAFKGELIC